VREKKDVPLGPEDPKEEDGSFDYRCVTVPSPQQLGLAPWPLHPHPLGYRLCLSGRTLAEGMTQRAERPDRARQGCCGSHLLSLLLLHTQMHLFVSFYLATLRTILGPFCWKVCSTLRLPVCLHPTPNLEDDDLGGSHGLKASEIRMWSPLLQQPGHVSRL
jgi:hypothetical protein